MVEFKLKSSLFFFLLLAYFYVNMATPRANLTGSEVEKAQELIRVLSSAISPHSSTCSSSSRPAPSYSNCDVNCEEPGPSGTSQTLPSYFRGTNCTSASYIAAVTVQQFSCFTAADTQLIQSYSQLQLLYCGRAMQLAGYIIETRFGRCLKMHCIVISYYYCQYIACIQPDDVQQLQLLQ